MAEQEHTEAERLRSAEVTLATIRHYAERMLAISEAAGVANPLPQARGYDRAMRDTLAILDARWLPEGAPVVLAPRARRLFPGRADVQNVPSSREGRALCLATAGM